jgi:hypothetical protein
MKKINMAESISPSQDKKRLKKCNFSREEIFLIQREVEKYYNIINSKHSNIITNEKKKKVWTEIAEKTSSLGVAIRTPNDIKELEAPGSLYSSPGYNNISQ